MTEQTIIQMKLSGEVTYTNLLNYSVESYNLDRASTIRFTESNDNTNNCPFDVYIYATNNDGSINFGLSDVGTYDFDCSNISDIFNYDLGSEGPVADTNKYVYSDFFIKMPSFYSNSSTSKTFYLNITDIYVDTNGTITDYTMTEVNATINEQSCYTLLSSNYDKISITKIRKLCNCFQNICPHK